jgi:hypothetical protein
VGVIVGVGVSLGVSVGVGVAVSVAVGVALGVSVAVAGCGVLLAVGVGGALGAQAVSAIESKQRTSVVTFIFIIGGNVLNGKIVACFALYFPKFAIRRRLNEGTRIFQKL